MPPRVLLRIAGLSMASTSSRPAFKVAAISLPALQSFAPSRCVHSKSRVASPPPSIANRRRLATHSDGPWAHQAGSHHPGGKKHPETVEETLRRLEGEAQKAAFSDNHEHVGPFPLGVGPSGRRKPWKPWGDLNIKGKLWRTTQQTGNLAVILIGGGLAVILTLALTTELFAKNSPSVLYSQCIDMIRDSDALDHYLLPPMTFTHTPTSSAPIRGSTPVVHMAVRNSGSGRDHLVLSFFVHGRGKDEPEPHHWLKEWWNTIETQGRKGLGLLGLAIDPVEEPVATVKPAEEQRSQDEEGSGFLGRMVGAFSLRGAASTVRSATNKLPPPGTYKSGEVRADYVKNASGQYTLLSLIVDVPNSRASYPGRAVVYWSPEADREGVLGGRR